MRALAMGVCFTAGRWPAVKQTAGQRLSPFHPSVYRIDPLSASIFFSSQLSGTALYQVWHHGDSLLLLEPGQRASNLNTVRAPKAVDAGLRKDESPASRLLPQGEAFIWIPLASCPGAIIEHSVWRIAKMDSLTCKVAAHTGRSQRRVGRT
jgi:hypothetical protein